MESNFKTNEMRSEFEEMVNKRTAHHLQQVTDKGISDSKAVVNPCLKHFDRVDAEFRLESRADGGVHYVKRTSEGKVCIATVHGLANSQDWCLEDTYHHYTDIWSSQIFESITDHVYIGSVDGSEKELQSRCVAVQSQPQLLLWSFDGKKLLYQLTKTFQSDVTLVSGTPIYNANRKLCSVVTGSSDNHYCLSGFYGPRGRIAAERVFKQPLDTDSPINYAHKSFQDKQSLVEYIEHPERVSGLYIRPGRNQVRIILVENGIESSIIYFEHKIINQFQ